MSVIVTLQYFDGCPNWRATLGALRSIAEAAPDVRLETELIDSQERAEARRFHGSPTVLVNGSDPFADEDAPVGLACRLYSTPDGFSGSPTVEQLEAAIDSVRSIG